MAQNTSKGLGAHPLNAKGLKVAVVYSRFNEEITGRLRDGAVDKLQQLGCGHIDTVAVPGAFEIPLAAQAMLKRKVDAVVAVGAVIRGDTPHFDYVCQAVDRGCSALQLEYGRPVAFGVITTENLSQAQDRAGGKAGNKGAEAAEVAVEMCLLLKALKRK